MELDALFTRAGLLAVALFAVGPVAATADPGSGELIFHQRCQACHVPGRPTPLGPNLAGVVGRKAGTTSFNYTPGMKSLGLIWTKANLEKYLAGPARMVPGTRMVISVPDAAQRKAVVEYLATLR